VEDISVALRVKLASENERKKKRRDKKGIAVHTRDEERGKTTKERGWKRNGERR
jgi:hypothetical protein